MTIDRARIVRLLGIAEFQRGSARFFADRDRTIKARAPPGVARPGTRLFDFDPDRVLIAVDAHLDHALDVAGSLAFAPEAITRAAVIPGVAALDGFAQR